MLWRQWPVWLAALSGVVLLVLTAAYPGVWWVLVLWIIAAGVAVGDARERSRKAVQPASGSPRNTVE